MGRCYNSYTTETRVQLANKSMLLSDAMFDLLKDDFYITCNGRRLEKGDVVDDAKCYRICPRLKGGKGGFGSMLRTIGAQIEKTTNREAMRDLSGRRMRDINNEKKLADWVAGASERERQQEERRQQRLEKRRAEAEGRMHKFRDEKYLEQKDTVATNLDDALTQGLKRSSTTHTSAPAKKKGKRIPASTSWAGLELGDLSSSDDEVEQKSADESELDRLRESTEVVPELPISKDETRVVESSPETPVVDSSPETPVVESSPETPVVESSPETRVVESSPETPVVESSPETPVVESSPETPVVESSPETRVVESSPETPVVESSPETKECDVHQKHVAVEVSSEKPEAGEQTVTAVDAPLVMEPIDLESHKSAEELKLYGLEHLKHELMSRGLKCGGSIEQRALRLYSVKGLSRDEVDASLFAKKRK